MMGIFRKKRNIEFHIDRIESSYGNIMVRGWCADRETQEAAAISVTDAKGEPLPVYVERLIRSDVNSLFGKEENYESGFHVLIDRAVINTSCVRLVFGMGENQRKQKIRVNRDCLHRALKGLGGQTEEEDYDAWFRKNSPGLRERRRQRAEKMEIQPLFSVVIPLYHTPKQFLHEILDSILGQTYENLEICLADGSSDSSVRDEIRKRYGKEKRIRYCRLKENRGISENTNAAIRMAAGDYLVFADHDDVLTPDALYELTKAINLDPKTEILYSDEDKINRSSSAYFGPHFKPDFNQALLCCNNYICHLFCVKRELAQKVGPLNAAFDGAQDYDYVLRCCEQTERICHIPKVLYHWRTHPASTAGNPESKDYAFEAGRKALEAHYKREKIPAETAHTGMKGRYRTWFAIEGEPLITILIPNKDHGEDLRRCIDSIRTISTYSRYEILVIENNSTQEETFALYKKLETEGIRVETFTGAFNYSRIHNFAVPKAKGEYLILLNNDTQVIEPKWMEEMLSLCQQKKTGAVGALLLYPDDTIQHAGVVLGLGGTAGHLYAGFPDGKEGYMGRLVSVQQVCAVTGACMMTKKSLYEKIAGMEEALAVAYNDIDYCLKLQKAGYQVLFTPYAKLYHYESKTRGLDQTTEQKKRLQKEAELFEARWSERLRKGDPFYNPNLSLVKADCSLRQR